MGRRKRIPQEPAPARRGPEAGTDRRPAERPVAIPLLAAVLVLLSAAVWYPVGNNGFINLDDDVYLTNNPAVKEGLTAKSFLWAWTTGVAANWHPLTWLSHLADVSLFGMNSGPMHLVSAGIHTATALLLFLLLLGATRAPWRSAMVAALFSVHPLRVQSVAWAAERKDVLSGLLFMVTLLLYLGYARRPTVGRYLAVTGCFALGLTAKPMLVTVPFLLLLLDFWPLRRVASLDAGEAPPLPRFTIARLLREKMPWLLLSVSSAAVTYFVQQGGGAMEKILPFPFPRRAVNAVWSAGWYVAKEVWPSGLAVQYPHQPRPVVEVAAAALLLAAVTVAAVMLRRRAPFLGAGWFWYLGMLVPVIGLVQVGSQGMADRYSYLPGIGLAIALVWGIERITRRLPARRAVLSVAGVALLAALAVATRGEIGHWRNSETLYRRALSVTEGNWLVHNNLAVVLAGEGRLDEAIEQASAGVGVSVDSGNIQNLATLLSRRGRYPEAIVQFRRALLGAPGNVEARVGLANALMAVGDLEAAGAEFREVIRLRPDFARGHNNYGIVLARQGRTAEALERFREAVRLAPGNVEALNNCAGALMMSGSTAEAVPLFREAVRLAPEDAGIRTNLAEALFRSGQLAEAERVFRDVVARDPGNARARAGLAATGARMSR